MADKSKVFTDWKAVIADIQNKKQLKTVNMIDSTQLASGSSFSIPVYFRNKKFNSSSLALDAYIWEHEGKTPKKFSGLPTEDVLDLLAPTKILGDVTNRTIGAGSDIQISKAHNDATLEQFLAAKKSQLIRKEHSDYGKSIPSSSTANSKLNIAPAEIKCTCMSIIYQLVVESLVLKCKFISLPFI